MGVLRNDIFLLALGAIKNKDCPVGFTGYVIDCYIQTYARFSPPPVEFWSVTIFRTIFCNWW